MRRTVPFAPGSCRPAFGVSAGTKGGRTAPGGPHDRGGFLMGAGRVAGAAIALALIGASAAQAAELSVTTRLQDRRVVAAGTRAQVLPFADGRFYANGWHTTGEMGGVFSPPIKLLDSLSFGVNGQWAGQATKFTSGEGYTRFDLPPIDGIGLQRTDVVPDGRRGGLFGLKLSNDRKNRSRQSSGSTRTPSCCGSTRGASTGSSRGPRTTRRTRAASSTGRSRSATRASTRARRATTPTRRSSAPTAPAGRRDDRPRSLRPVRPPAGSARAI